ncbi:MAG: preprotein translocase subunit SecY [Elusimicrobiaceae bacterium]|nr:preprotein translocase subunit SecY [Elusimicrobiaceae bacterium]MBT3955248.1 preprotein translocase subunit SecY [Elusimicrobiaceae bacterium]MBT4007704.1 preprotein translocase subunit SecY [Elusimicrobiaceae bacterium]MBT4402408.1 preprotein translocase subunit SecY [Elusimicrobiaceae bacterium]MBT4440403.1 preprotein translocase subunit SecY [Elusimicrobiaceae bacterium]
MDQNNALNMFKSSDLKKRLLFVLIALAIFRLGAAIPIPGINADALKAIFEANKGGILGILDMFSGGALGKFSILALGIMPYINASIIMSLLKGAHVLPILDSLSKEGEAGRRKINQITRVFALVLSVLQSFGLTFALAKMSAPGGVSAVINPSPIFYITTIITLATGTMFIIWLGEQITERGIGNGISLIIFAGIVERLPAAVKGVISLVLAEELTLVFAIILTAAVFLIMGFVVWVETGQRQIPVQYAKRMVGRQMYGGQTTYLPIKVDQSGVIAVIFAMALMSLPLTLAQFNPEAIWAQKIVDAMQSANAIYLAVLGGLIMFFCYFYNSITFNPKEFADNLKKWGGFIPGIRPGEPTRQYIEWVLNRITFFGALFIVAIAIMPSIAQAQFNVPFYFGGTAILIVVGVALDTVGQIQAHAMSRNYEPLMKGKKIKGRWFNVGS